MRRAIAVALIAAVAVASAQADGPGVREQPLVEAFLARDAPEARAELLAARRALAEAARASAPAWQLRAEREESRGDLLASTTDVLGASVEFELGSRRSLEQGRAAAEGEAFRLGMRAELGETVSDLRLFLVEVARAEGELGVLLEWQERVDALVTEHEGLVAGGELSRFDLLRMQDLARSHRHRVELTRAAAAAGGLRLERLTGFAGPVVLGSHPPLPSDDAVRALVLEDHPRLAALRRRVEASSAAVTLAGRSHPAALELSGGYRREDEPGTGAADGYELGVGVTLPRRALRRLAVAGARADQGESSLALVRAERDVAATLDGALAKARLLPAPTAESAAAEEEIREGALRRYRMGESDLTELVEVLGSLEERSLLRIDAGLAHHVARVELDRVAALLTAPEIARMVDEAIK